MFGLQWSNPQTLWLNLTNLALGAVTLAAVLVAIGGLVWEFGLRRRRTRELAGLDAELKAMFDASPQGIPGLGVTMADGGVPVSSPHSGDPATGRN